MRQNTVRFANLINLNNFVKDMCEEIVLIVWY